MVRQPLWPTIVRIESKASDGIRVGTGFAVDAKGIIATNLHVVAGSSEIRVTLLDKTSYPVKRIIGWSVGGFFALLFAAGIVIRVAKAVLGPDIFTPGAAVAVAPTDPNSAFISQAKAEQLHEMSAKQLMELRRMPPDQTPNYFTVGARNAQFEGQKPFSI